MDSSPFFSFFLSFLPFLAFIVTFVAMFFFQKKSSARLIDDARKRTDRQIELLQNFFETNRRMLTLYEENAALLRDRKT